MYNPIKPDLIVHPIYYKSILEYNLHEVFNVLQLNDLTLNLDFQPKLVRSNGAYPLYNVKLNNFYSNKLVKLSGMKPEYTSYSIKDQTPMYTIEQNGPRYVIWTKDLPLTVCATYIDRICDYELYAACVRARQWAATSDIMASRSIIVFDLDCTLIDDDGNKLQYADQVLQLARQKYDLVILYSHGSHLHVDEHVQQFENWHLKNTTSNGGNAEDQQLFNLILSNGPHGIRSNKNLLHLYNYFPNTRFNTAVLVDDSLYNWTPEYTEFIVPATTTSIYHVLPLI